MSVGKQPTNVGKERTEVAKRVLSYLRALYPQKTIDNVSGATRIPTDRIEKWFERGSPPSLPDFGKLVIVFGPEFAAAVFPSCEWMSAEARRKRADKLREQIAADQRRLQELTDL